MTPWITSAVNTVFVERVVELGASEEHFLDLGTGPAQIPIFLAQRCPEIRITGIDLSVNMLTLGEQHVAEAGLADRSHWNVLMRKPYPIQINR